MKLGLNRLKEEYEELLLALANDDINNNNNNNKIKLGTKVKVKGLVKASVHNKKIGIVRSLKVCTSSIPGKEHRRLGVEISDDNGGTVVVAIKIENLETVLASASATMMTTTTNTNRPNPHEYLVGRKILDPHRISFRTEILRKRERGRERKKTNAEKNKAAPFVD